MKTAFNVAQFEQTKKSFLYRKLPYQTIDVI